jgi:dipeptidyl aminopeptidase/acylaminoacyl peptidase
MSDATHLFVGKDEHGGLPSLPRPDAPKAPHWSLEAVAAVERPHHSTVSPDGRRVAFLLDRETTDVWCLPASGGSAQRLTTGRPLHPFWEDTAPAWSSDGTRVAYAEGGGVWLVPETGGRPRRLAEAGDPVWLDPNRMLVTADRDQATRLAVLGVDDPWPRSLTPAEYSAAGAVPVPGSDSVVYEAHPPEDFDRSDLWAVEAGSGQARHLCGAPGRLDHSPAVDPRGTVAAYASERDGWDEICLVALDGSGERRLTHEGADFSEPAWRPDGGAIAAVRTRSGRTDLVLIEAASGAVSVVAPGGIWSRPQWAEGDALVAVYEDHRTPPCLVRVEPDGTVRTLASGVPAAVASAPHVTPERISYRSGDGLEVEGFLFKPAAAAHQPVPAVVYPHGGPTSFYGDEWDGHAQYFVDKGYAWLAVNFRGSTSYGQAFERANRGVWGVADTADCLAAADYLAGLDWVDRRRLAIFGASYGSYMALAALALDPEHRFACGVAKFGDSDIATSWAEGDRAGREDLERMMRRPTEAPDAYRAGSPLHRVDDIARPLLVAHGEQDARVPPRQSAQLVEALRRAGKTFEYLTYPTEGHGFLRWEPQLHFYRRLERFLDWHLM